MNISIFDPSILWGISANMLGLWVVEGDDFWIYPVQDYGLYWSDK